jgi:hypothetical protein
MQRIVVPPMFGNLTQCASPQAAQSVTSEHSVGAMHGPQQPSSVTLTVSPAGQLGGRLLQRTRRSSQLVANVQRPSVHFATAESPLASQALPAAQARAHAGDDVPLGKA